MVDCSEIKRRMYDCIKSKVNFDPIKLSFLAKNQAEVIENYRIPTNLLIQCGQVELAKCLNNKYPDLNYDNMLLKEYFENQYDKEISKANENKRKINEKSQFGGN